MEQAWKTENTNRDANLAEIERLVKEEGYKDIGWCNSGAKFSQPMTADNYTELDCSLYNFRNTNTVYINHDVKEIKHVDMSD